MKAKVNYTYLSSLYLALVVLLATQTFPALAQNENTEKADAVITGAPIYTVDAQRSWAEAMAIKNGRIAYVGSTEGAKKWMGTATKVANLKGGMILPGFHDSHVHIAEGGLELEGCLLHECKTTDQIYKAVEKYAQEHKDAPWILGSGWALPLFKLGAPHKKDLDKIIADRPVLLMAEDWHSGWANSKALALAGITKTTKDPDGGRIERDGDGEPTGTLRESAAELVGNIAPKPTMEQRVKALRRSQKLANGFGITSIQDAHATEEVLATYCELAKSGELTLKTVAAQDTDAKDLQVSTLVERRKRYETGLLRAHSAKIFGDGVIESHTAALLSPYSDRPKDRGILNFEPDKLRSLCQQLDKEGFQIHIHAIGDRGVREALNALEAAQQTNGSRDSRHQIAHLEMIDPQDLPRFRKLGVIANYEPYWAWADPYILKGTVPVLGKERSSRLYQIQSMLNTGAVVSAGSDWTVSTLNPLAAIQVAITRKGLDQNSGDAWLPQERTTLPQIIAAYTICGAYVNKEEHETGSLEVGKAADLIVLDKNLFEIPPEQISKTKVLLTILNGKVVHRDESFTLLTQ